VNERLSRRSWIGQAGVALGGLAAGALAGCGGEDDPAPIEPPVDTTPQVNQFPYEQHLAAGYRLQADPVKESAYHAYYVGGCCHGAYSALLGHLATTAGAPFDKLPLDFGRFGGGGIASYGSICGAVLGGVLILNQVVGNATARAAMMTDLIRWYEGFAFPAYSPTAVDAGETGTTKDFSATGLVQLQRAPHSHLCHASVSDWCAAQGVSATGPDKKARCARLTADVAGKVVEMVNAYLANQAYTAQPLDGASASCVGCHTSGSTLQPVQSGMSCSTCHPDKLSGHPAPR
jgi:hypothetical protein